MSRSYAPVGELGRNASRRVTDVLGIVIFVAAWVFTFILLGSAACNSTVDKMLYGTDFEGNICGRGNQSDRPVLWYPINFNPGTGFNFKYARTMALCAHSCLKADFAPYGNYPRDLPTGYYPSGVNSQVVLHRCIPSFGFAEAACNSSGMSPAEQAECEKAARNGRGSLMSSLGVTSVWFGIVQNLHDSYGIIITLVVIAIILSFGWLYSMRAIVKPIAVVSAVGLLLAMILLGALALHAHHKQDDANSDSARGFLAAGVLCFIAAFLYFCFLLYIWKDLMIACNIVVEASKVIMEIPQMIVVPALSTIFITGFGILFAALAVLIYTAGDYKPREVSGATAPDGSAVYSQEFASKDWRVAGQLFNIFMFLWTMGFFHAVSMMVIAMCCVQWYWSAPGLPKVVPSSPVLWAVKTTLVYHTGTVALGSLLIAMVQWCRVVLRMFEKRLIAMTGNASTGKVLLCCAQCCLACFERIVKFLTAHAYVMTAMTGDSLLPGARAGMHLLAGNMKVLGVNILGDVVITLGKVLLTALNVFFAYLWLNARDESSSNQLTSYNFLLLLVLIGLLTYFITSVFATVFSITIDSVLLCYCYDVEINDGGSRPYYAPPSLQQHVHHSHARSGGKAAEAKPLIA